MGFELLPGWLRSLLDPANPFIPWLLIFDLTLIVAHMAMVLWVYRDAFRRYNRGIPWAVLAAVFPVGGWLFYLLYRVSPLVEMDRMEAETFDDSEHEWNDYDQYRANRSAQFFKDLGSHWHKKPEVGSYSPWIRHSRERELRKRLTPEQVRIRKKDLVNRRAALRVARQKRLQEKKLGLLQRRTESRNQRTLTGAHGFRYSLSLKSQKRLKRKLALVEQLKQLPREDPMLEELIYSMDYEHALSSALDNLHIAQEMKDQQGVLTYQAYVNRIRVILGIDPDSPDPALPSG